MTSTDLPCNQLSEMRACAYRLGMAFGREAERAGEPAETVRWFELFERCFFAVRVATALELRLARAPTTAREAATDRDDFVETEPPEREPAERLRFEYDRDRETERASLPVFLKTLRAIAADSSALPGPEPAELPTLRKLLARTAGETPAAGGPAASGLRTRLAGSAAAPVAVLSPPGPAPRPALPLRPATGPPRR
jgi:hypothetical protein